MIIFYHTIVIWHPSGGNIVQKLAHRLNHILKQQLNVCDKLNDDTQREYILWYVNRVLNIL